MSALTQISIPRKYPVLHDNLIISCNCIKHLEMIQAAKHWQNHSFHVVPNSQTARVTHHIGVDSHRPSYLTPMYASYIIHTSFFSSFGLVLFLFELSRRNAKRDVEAPHPFNKMIIICASSFLCTLSSASKRPRKPDWDCLAGGWHCIHGSPLLPPRALVDIHSICKMVVHKLA